jgi:mannose-6-phosphate isomerase-like protein (cupin superfamily)
MYRQDDIVTRSTTKMDIIERVAAMLPGRTREIGPGLIVNHDAIQSQTSESFTDSSKGIVTWKTLISAPQTATDSLTVGVASCPPQQGHLCPHRHTQAEVYHIISGRGIMQIDGKEQEVAAGSVVYIPGDAKHGIRNDDPEQELKWLYVFGADSFEDIKYRF